MAIELKNSIVKDLAISFPVVKLLQGLSIIQLAQALLERIDTEEPLKEADSDAQSAPVPPPEWEMGGFEGGHV